MIKSLNHTYCIGKPQLITEMCIYCATFTVIQTFKHIGNINNLYSSKFYLIATLYLALYHLYLCKFT